MKWNSIFFTALAALMLTGCSKDKERETPPPAKPEYDIYVAGSYRVGNVISPIYWKDGEWTGLEIPGASDRIYVRSIVVSDGTVYVAGDSGEFFGYWKDGRWHQLTAPEGTVQAYCYSIACSEARSA